MKAVSSSAIAAIGYDPQTGVMRIRFHSGSAHDYPNTSLEEFQRFAKAPSLGKHFHRHFRGKDSSRVKE